MKNIIEIALKKLLGKGRAFRTPKGLMSDFLDLIVSPFSELKTRFIGLKFTHFPTVEVDENDIINGEELFNIQDIQGKTLEERAANVESQWSIFAGSQTFKQIENILRKKGYDVRVIENIPPNYNLYGARTVGNGFIQTESGKKDPIVITNKKHTFIVQSNEFYEENDFLSLIETLVKNKPGHNGSYIIPRFLRKKEIHNKLTKSQMQTYKKKQYCDCRVVGKLF